MSNDVVIIQRVLNGDEDAFTILVRQYQGVVFALTYHYVSDFQDAQEVAQDVFMKVYRRLDTLKDPNCFSSWLRRIVYTESMMFLRKRKKVSQHTRWMQKAWKCFLRMLSSINTFNVVIL